MKGRRPRVRAREFASVSLHPAFLDLPQSTPSGSYDICFSRKDFPASTFPLRWAYLCGMFKKVFVPHYQAPPYDGTRVCLGGETEQQTTG